MQTNTEAKIKLAEAHRRNTPASTLASILAVDGAGSGLDADLLDGQHGAAFQAALISATNIKTVNGSSLLGSGDLIVSGGGANLTYTAATRVIASDTGTDATLPLMSSGDAGLVPASGGGTANFLRADGTFAAPAGGSYQSPLWSQLA